MEPLVSDIFSFIKHSKATQSASLKVLQKFILSLNKMELQHLITLYLKSVVKEFIIHKANGLTLKQSVQRLLNNHKDNDGNSNSKTNSIDNQILNKMQENYSNKHNKKLMKQLQQNHDENKHLLSITPHTLASTLYIYVFRIHEKKTH